jgi:hypothetical protein
MESNDTEFSVSSRDSQYWKLWGNRKLPKPELVYITQIIILYIIIICSLVNLTLDRGESALWISLLSLCIRVSILTSYFEIFVHVFVCLYFLLLINFISGFPSSTKNKGD